MPKGIFKRKQHTQETRLKMSNTHKGRKAWNKGKKGVQHHSKKVRERISKAHLGMKPANSGEKSQWWRGGITLKHYPEEWTNTLKRAIRERDNYTCRMCGKSQKERAFSVHHIDYNKQNCDPNNLITLCQSCHVKTNSGERELWIKYFKNYQFKIINA